MIGKTRLLEIGVVTASFFLALYGAEYLIRRFTRLPLNAYDARRTILDMVQDHRELGEHAYPLMFPRQFLLSDRYAETGERFFPVSGLSNRLTVFCNEGVDILYRSDEHGFNNPLGHYRATVDFVMIGDSFANGACTEAGESIAGQLRQLSGASLLNLGISGDGPLVELATLSEFAPSLRPRVVLWFFFEGNDIGDLSLEWSRSDLLPHYLDDGFTQNLISRQAEVDRYLESEFHSLFTERFGALSFISFFKLREQIGKRLGLNERDNLGRMPKYTKTGPPLTGNFAGEDQFSRIIARADSLTRSWGGTLYFVYLPQLERYTTRTAEGNRDEIIRLVRRLNVPVVDFDAVLARSADPRSFYRHRASAHYSAKGYHELALFVLREMQRRKSSVGR